MGRIDEILKVDEEAPRRQRHTAAQIFRRLAKKGYAERLVAGRVVHRDDVVALTAVERYRGDLSVLELVADAVDRHVPGSRRVEVIGVITLGAEDRDRRYVMVDQVGFLQVQAGIVPVEFHIVLLPCFNNQLIARVAIEQLRFVSLWDSGRVLQEIHVVEVDSRALPWAWFDGLKGKETRMSHRQTEEQVAGSQVKIGQLQEVNGAEISVDHNRGSVFANPAIVISCLRSHDARAAPRGYE